MAKLLLFGAIALLMIDSIMEMGFIVAMVSWIHRRGGEDFLVNYNGEEFSLNGKPLNLLVDQGHTSNGAAGTAFVVIGLGGIAALFLRQRQLKHRASIHGFTAGLYNFWLYMTAISAVFTVAAFVYVFVVTYTHNGQHIDVAFASTLNNKPPPGNVPYPRDTWTPQNWFPAVLELDLASASDRSDTKLYVAVMRAWQWNLIPMMVLGVIVSILAFGDRMRQRGAHGHKTYGASSLESARQKNGNPYS